jgi:hypothetical protein
MKELKDKDKELWEKDVRVGIRIQELRDTVHKHLYNLHGEFLPRGWCSRVMGYGLQGVMG